MTLNHKQKELIEQLVKEIETKFPETKFIDAAASPESGNTIWLEFTHPHNEEKFMEIIEYAGGRTMDILLDYGYHFLVLPSEVNGKPAAQLHH
ncbi:hypothetical protein HUU05_28955 [candidate division KSB1 bacterium]|nr:hypothetical protein [candidate division KSB1 bacterium]